MSARLLPLASLATLLVTVPAAPVALAQSGGGLAACRALADAAQRLACYDALPLTPALPATAAGVGASVLPATSASPTAGTGSAAPVAQFGLEQRAASSQPEAIDSHIEGRFTGWGPKERIRLANGQVWQIVDGSTGAMDFNSPKVRVRRGMLGAFFLEIAGTHRSPRVKRVE